MAYDLRNIVLDPKPPPSIEVIFTIGHHPDLESTCREFARHFDFQFISVTEYLKDLLNDKDHVKRQEALGSLHPHTIASILKRGQRVPAQYLVPILHRKIDEDVRKGYHKFIILGLAQDVEAVTQFSLEIATPSAVFAFFDHEQEAYHRKGGIEQFYRPRLLVVRAEKDDSTLYQNLLAAIGHRVWRGGAPPSERQVVDEKPMEMEVRRCEPM